MTIVEFILARVADDEAAARAAIRVGGGWISGDEADVYEGDLARANRCEEHALGEPNDCDDERVAEAIAVDDDPRLISARADHIARHDPARVLAECEAKRRIVEMGQFDDSPESAVDWWLAEGVPDRTPPQPLGTLIAVFRALASVYADHPAFDPEWRL